MFYWVRLFPTAYQILYTQQPCMCTDNLSRNERSRAKAGHIFYRIIWYGRMYEILIKIMYSTDEGGIVI